MRVEGGRGGALYTKLVCLHKKAVTGRWFSWSDFFFSLYVLFFSSLKLIFFVTIEILAGLYFDCFFTHGPSP